MQHKLRNRCGSLSAIHPLSACGMLTLLALSAANGQSVLIAPPVIPAELRTTESTSDTNQVDGADGAVATSPGSAMENKNPFQWGPVVLHPRLGYGFNYSTGLQSQRGQPSRTAINTVSPGIGIDLGKHWDLGYTAAAAFYSDPKFKDNVDHNLTIHGHTTYEDWGFDLSQSVAITSDAQVETAQQTDEQNFSTSFATTYQISSELSTEVTLGQELSSSQGTSQAIANSVGSTKDWTLSSSLNYQLGPGVSTGLGLGFGYDMVDIGPDTTYENVNLQLNWQLARKFTLSLNGGAQIRQFLGSGQSSLVSPTFGAALHYRPFYFTSISLAASRGINASLFQSQVTESTSVNLNMSQRLFKRFFLSLNGGYSLSTYLDSAPGGAPGIHGREDTRTYFGVSLSTAFLKRGNASLTYSKSRNSSSPQTSGFGYNSDQVGVSVSYGY